MLIRVRRNAVDAREATTPGYRAAVEAIARAADATHYTVSRDEYHATWRKYAGEALKGIAQQRPKRVAIGDAVERMLTSLGITKERVQAWTRTKDCGCKARQKWLNQWGYRKQEQLDRVLKKAARWYGIS